MTSARDLLQEALRSLPHGPEFRFVDRLLSLNPGKDGVGEYLVRGDEPWLRGHLPGDPLLPGVLLVEAAAQMAGVVAQNDPLIPPLPGLKLTALRNVKILGSARPGETARLEARITGRLGALVQAQASVFVSGAKVLSAELTLSGTTGAGQPSLASAGPETPGATSWQTGERPGAGNPD
jgi:3-hydroxyacyl-[acyl-carrier-protein] dehydratase